MEVDVQGAIKAAAAALYLEDSSDYQTALYEVLSALGAIGEDENPDDARLRELAEFES